MAEGTIKIKEMEELTELTDNDYFVVDNLQSGVPTKKYKATRVIQMIENVADEIEEKITPSIDTALAVGSVSGDIASFSDGSTLPMPKLQVGIEPQQDLHGYDAPWVGGAGKNLFDKPNLVMNKAIPAGTTIYGQIFGVTASFKLYGYDEENTEYEVMSLSINKNSVTTTRAYARLEISQSALNALGNGNLMVSLSDFTRFEPYSNICPISGWSGANVSVCGTNIWDEQWEVGAISNSNGKNYALVERVRDKNYISVKPNTPYYLYLPNTYSNARIACYDKDKEYLGQATGWLSVNNNTAFTTPSNTYYIRLVVVKTDETYNNDISINYPSTDTEYHAYNGQTYTIDLDGTRYGGQLDVVSGELVVDRASIKLNDLNWIKQNTTSGNWRFISSQSIQNIKLPTDASWKIDNLCSVYQNVTANETWIAEKTGIAINVDGKLLICDLNQADITALGVVIANQTYCYELATPITYQLTPTQVKSLLGSNNVWADTGEIIDCEYKRDATAIINSLIARIEALENQ